MGLSNSLLGMILPFVAGPFGVFLMRQYIMALPDELIQAARIDGAGELRIFASVIMPLCGPALATLGILTFLGSWNNFLWPLVVAQTEDKYTLPVALALYAVGQNATQYGLLLAGSVVVVVPVLVIFLFLQRHIMQGIAMTGIKYARPHPPLNLGKEHHPMRLPTPSSGSSRRRPWPSACSRPPDPLPPPQAAPARRLPARPGPPGKRPGHLPARHLEVLHRHGRPRHRPGVRQRRRHPGGRPAPAYTSPTNIGAYLWSPPSRRTPA